MKQLIHHLDRGRLEIIEAPQPTAGPGQVVVRALATVISPGTERLLVGFGRAGALGKLRQQPQRALQVWHKARTEGPVEAAQAVLARLREPLPMGYAMCGQVVAVGPGVSHVRVGQRVACNGPHAQLARVPATLCVPAPEGLPDEHVAAATLAAIALQGVRLASVTLGERMGVIGLGLLGQLTAQLLRAHGCQVFALEPRADRVALAQRLALGGVGPSLRGWTSPDDLLEAAAQVGGLDGVIVCAATSDDSPLRLAARACRLRGRVVLTGVSGMSLERDVLYARELTLHVSSSYGPGRYAHDYEALGADYDPGVLRWTAGRNMEAALELMARGALQVEPLGVTRHPFERACEVYDAMMKGQLSGLLVALTYPACAPPSPGAVPSNQAHAHARAHARPAAPQATREVQGKALAQVRLGVVGAGHYATRTLLPALASLGAAHERAARDEQSPEVIRVALASGSGLKAALGARAFGFAQAASSLDDLLDPALALDAVMILTRHDSHAALAIEALRAGLHVFVEKPLAHSPAALEALLDEARQRPAQHLMVGLNRRWSPWTLQLMRELEGAAGPKHLLLTINAGPLPEDHWTLRADQGGRLVGELCHAVDWARAVVGSPIAQVQAARLAGRQPAQSASAALTFEDGSVASIHYTALGSTRMTKERFEVFAAGRVWQLDGWRALRRFGASAPRGVTLPALRPDKGHQAMLRRWFLALRQGHACPLPLEQAVEVARATFAIAQVASWTP